MSDTRFITLYAFDLDHTLIQPENILKTVGLARLRSFLESERQDGAIITLVSGRNKEDVVSAIKEARFLIPDYIITNLGSGVYSKRDGFVKSLLHIKNKDWKRKEIDSIARNVSGVTLRKASRSTRFKLSYYFNSAPAVSSRVRCSLGKKNLNVDVITAKNKYLYLVPKNINKASALKFLIKKTGLKFSEIFAAGDDHMDLPMLKMAGSGVLVLGNEGVVGKNPGKHIYISGLRYAEGVLSGIRHARPGSRLESTRQRFWSFLNRGDLQEDRGYFNRAEESYKIALSFARSLGYERGIILSLFRLGRVQTSLGNVRSGIDLIGSVYKRMSNGVVSDKILLAEVINSLAFAYRIHGQTGTAKKYLHKAFGIKGLNGKILASLYHNRGGLNRDMNNLRGALNDYRKALTLNRTDKVLKVRTVNNIGFILRRQGRLSEALVYYKEAISAQKKLGLLSLMARTLNNIGGVYRIKNETRQALEYFLKSAKIRKSIGDVMGLSSSYLNAGRVLLDMGKPEEAKKFLLMSLKIRKRLHIPHMYKEVANEIKNVLSFKNN